jgi:hypothetical protein
MQDPTEKHVSDVGILDKYNNNYYYYYRNCFIKLFIEQIALKAVKTYKIL